VLEKHDCAEVCGVGGSLGCRRACDASVGVPEEDRTWFESEKQNGAELGCRRVR